MTSKPPPMHELLSDGFSRSKGNLMDRRTEYGSASLVLEITPAERNALQLLAIGTPADEVARNLGAAESDGESQLTRLFAAMGAANQTEAVAIALKRGLLNT